MNWTEQLLSSPGSADLLKEKLRSFIGEESHRAVRKESMWVMSNLLGGSDAIRDFLLTDSVVVDNLLNAICSDEFDLQKESLFALTNACLYLPMLSRLSNHSSQVVRQLVRMLNVGVDQEVFRIFCSLFMHVLIDY